MNAAYACAICAREIPSASTHSVGEWGTVLCAVCVENPESHSVAYPGCPVASHGVHDHPMVVGTRLGAHRALMHLRREVASG
ncbi:MAG: hypothetical protein ACRDUX_35725 [Mycobacterium sp.]